VTFPSTKALLSSICFDPKTAAGAKHVFGILLFLLFYVLGIGATREKHIIFTKYLLYFHKMNQKHTK
jgi:hypothetical protein